MYAVISESGRQYRVEKGQELNVDYRDLPPGEKLTFDRVLAVSDEGQVTIGTPTVDGAKVEAEVVGARMGDKLTIQKFRRRKNSRRRTGHRQLYTRVRINAISV